MTTSADMPVLQTLFGTSPRDPVAKRWLVLLPAALMGLLWGKGAIVPTLSWASTIVSFVLVGLAGSLVQVLLGAGPSPDSPRPGIFQRLFLGQYLLFVLAFAIALPAAVFANLTGLHIPLRFSLPVALLGLTYLARRKRPEVFDAPFVQTCPTYSLLLTGMVGFGFYRALALHTLHAGALGHDTVQHIYWTQHILDFGYLPLTSRGTNLIEEYPRYFHLLAAGWTSAGLFGPVGPHVKMMPFLQASLACGFFCELLLAGKPGQKDKLWTLAPLLLGAFVSWHLTRGDGQEVYRIHDLSGTPRTSAGWLLFGFPLLAFADRIGTVSDMRARLVFLAPVFVCIALGINPSTTLFVVSFTLPFTGIFYLVNWDKPGPSLRVTALRAAQGLLVGAAFVIANPLVLEKLAKLSPTTNVLRWLGVRTQVRGLSVEAFDARPGPPPALCESSGLSCGADLVKTSIDGGLTSYWDSISEGTLPGIVTGSHTLWYYAVFGSAFLALVLVSVFGPAPRPSNPRSARAFLGFLVACLLTPLFLMTGNALLGRFAPLNDLWNLLYVYYRPHAVYLSVWLQCALTTLPWILVPVIALSPRRFALVAGLGAASLALSLSLFTVKRLRKHRHAGKEWSFGWDELRAIDRLNAFVPEGDTVLIPAWHWHTDSSENVLSADGPEGIIVPHLTTGILFGVRLGTGKDYGWRDLTQRLCGTSEARRDLLREANVRWVLLRSKTPLARDTYETTRWVCGLRFADLNAEYPAAWSEGDLALFRIRP